MRTQRYELIEEHRSGHTFYHLQDNYGKLSIYKDIYHCVYLLNQQDARIKELESQLSLQKSKSELVAENEGMKDTIAVVLAQKRNTLKNNDELRKENQQLINQYDLLNKK